MIAGHLQVSLVWTNLGDFAGFSVYFRRYRQLRIRYRAFVARDRQAGLEHRT